MSKSLVFKDLWNAYPSDPPCSSDGKPNHSNQCAIRVGTALAKCGVNTSALGVAHCWHHEHSAGHVLRAEELANALTDRNVPGVGKRQNLEAKGYASKIAGKTGIIFFKDYWMRDRDRDGVPTGDHIDLWQGRRMTSRASWLRVQLGIVMPGMWEDLEKAKCVYFWEVK
jgi:hypothetical protein